MKYTAKINKVANWCPATSRGDHRRLGITNWDLLSQDTLGPAEFGPTIEAAHTADMHHVKILKDGEQVMDFGIIAYGREDAKTPIKIKTVVNSYLSVLNKDREPLRTFDSTSEVGFHHWQREYDDEKAFSPGSTVKCRIFDRSKLNQLEHAPFAYTDELGHEFLHKKGQPDWSEVHVFGHLLITCFAEVVEDLAREICRAYTIRLNENYEYKPTKLSPFTMPTPLPVSKEEQVERISKVLGKKGGKYKGGKNKGYVPGAPKRVPKYLKSWVHYIPEVYWKSDRTVEDCVSAIRKVLPEVRAKEPTMTEGWEKDWIIDFAPPIQDNNRHTDHCKKIRDTQRIANSCGATILGSVSYPWRPTYDGTPTAPRYEETSKEIKELKKTRSLTFEEELQRHTDTGEALYLAKNLWYSAAWNGVDSPNKGGNDE